MALPTLGEHDSTGELVRGHCEGCQHSSYLDVEHLARRLGPRTPLIAVNPRLRCTRCGRRGGTIRLAVIGTGPASKERRVIVDRDPPWTPLPRGL